MIRLLDTNIVSFLVNRHTLRHRYAKHIRGVQRAISFQTLAKLEEGALNANWGLRRRMALASVLGTLTIYHSDEVVVQKYADVRVARRRQPIPARRVDRRDGTGVRPRTGHPRRR